MIGWREAWAHQMRWIFRHACLLHLLRYVRPSVVRHTFGIPFCQRLWGLTKRQDDIALADMVADMEVDMVAEMEGDMVAEMKEDKAVMEDF